MAKRVYFAFYYQDVIDFRANVVRNHKLTKGVEKAGYFDASIWEEAKKTSDLAVKRMINPELQNTSVTVVLIGTETYERPWVRYEILKSVERGNVLLGVHINGIAGKNQKTKSLGPNPFYYLGHEISSNGKKASPVEWENGRWYYYDELAPYQLKSPRPDDERDKVKRLSTWVPVYDWVEDDGYNNFNDWIS